MSRERRIFERFRLDIAGSLYLCQGRYGEKLCRPISCRVQDFSQKGACVVTNLIIVDSRHLFFAALESDKFFLHLEFTFKADGQTEAETFTLPVRPVWFDRLIDEEQKPFKIGIEFFKKMDEEQFQRIRNLAP
ncbi:MAG: PilZ domain-containing protein [Pseudomonadota bacterium]